MSELENDPTRCLHGKRWFVCKEKECIAEMHRMEDQATCKHGFMVGCPTCTQSNTLDTTEEDE